MSTKPLYFGIITAPNCKITVRKIPLNHWISKIWLARRIWSQKDVLLCRHATPRTFILNLLYPKNNIFSFATENLQIFCIFRTILKHPCFDILKRLSSKISKLRPILRSFNYESPYLWKSSDNSKTSLVWVWHQPKFWVCVCEEGGLTHKMTSSSIKWSQHFQDATSLG